MCQMLPFSNKKIKEGGIFFMKFNLNVEKRTFKNSAGEEVEYFDLTFDLLGSKIKVKPVDEDKKLCNYLLKNYKGGDKV